jgi:hypothetical protein
MQKILFTILLSSFLITSTELHEMFKIGAFFEHYFEHKQTDEDIDFIDFITLHYSDEQHDESNNKLPFKSHHENNFVAKLFKINFTKSYTSESIIFRYIKKVFVINNENRNSSQFIDTIWQPPKF